MTWTPPDYTEWEHGDRVFDDMIKEQVLDNLVYLLGAINTVVGVGNIILSGRSSPPAGFLLCDGAEIVRADYPALYAVIGTTFGAGDGTTTFKIPDLRQRFPIGKAASGTASVLGSTGGLIGHSHVVPTSGSAGAHGHTQGVTGSGGNHAHTNPNTVAAGSHNHGTYTHGATKGVVGGHIFWGLAVPAAYQEEHRHGIATQATHVHDMGNTSNAGAHTHTNPNVASGGAHTHPNTNPTGTADPPWLALNYIIRVTPFG